MHKAHWIKIFYELWEWFKINFLHNGKLLSDVYTSKIPEENWQIIL